MWRKGCSKPSRFALIWLIGLFVYILEKQLFEYFWIVCRFVIYWRRNIGSYLTRDADSLVYMKGYWRMIQRFKLNHHNRTDLLHKARTHATHTHTHSRSPVTCNILFDVRSLARQTTASGTVRQFQYRTKCSQTQFYKTELDWREGSVTATARLCWQAVSIYETTTISVHRLHQERLRSTSNSMVAVRTPEKKHVARCLFWLYWLMVTVVTLRGTAVMLHGVCIDWWWL